MVTIALGFPVGMYHALAQADFARAEWPPHPVRLVAALVAAAHGGPGHDVDAARAVIDVLARAEAPVIVAPRRSTVDEPGDDRVSELRGASRWAPRNHELGELGRGVSPRDLGRGRAEVHKGGIAIGEHRVSFAWPDVELTDAQLDVLTAVVADLTFLGTSRSPVVASVRTDPGAPQPSWRPTTASQGSTDVRVPDERTLAILDRWHERRSAPLARNGAPARAPLVTVPRLGSVVAYRHDADPVPIAALDPQTWGDMLVLRVVGDVTPMARATFAVARATRKALLDTYASPGSPGEAPSVLRGRGGEPHAAFVPLSFIAEPGAGSAGDRADGHVVGVAILLPHESRLPDVLAQREEVVAGLVRLMGGVDVRVPGVGPIQLNTPDDARPLWSLQEGRYRSESVRWTTAIPLVHSRYATRKGPEALLEQVTAECRDVGLPGPVQVEVRRGARLRGAPDRIDATALPASWTGPLKGPHAHLDLWFDRPVAGPVVLGRARHFGLGLCLPFSERGAA